MMESMELIGYASEEADAQLKVEEENESYARLVAEPLEPGYGITLGNALRRVLLSSLEGAAISRVRIDHVHHEFSTIEGMQEDITEFLFNLKEVWLRPLSNRGGTLTLDVEGPGEVRARDIQFPADFEIVNPDLLLATLDNKKAHLVVEMNAEMGKGYQPAGSVEGLPIGVVPVDAIFTPVRKVNYRVEKTRVGQSTDFDRLVLDVWTDGTIGPVEAVSQSADILMDQFALFSAMGRPELPVVERGLGTGLALPPDKYNTPIEDLSLSVRAYNCLKRSGLMTVGQVLEKSEDELLALRNFGRKSYDELRDRLAELGYIDGSAEGLQPIADGGHQTGPAAARPPARRPQAIRTSQVILDEDDEEQSLGALGKALKEALREQGVEDLIGADDED